MPRALGCRSKWLPRRVGTIAPIVAKAYADLSPFPGRRRTGASPLTSIRYAGSPWELGLS